MKKLITWVVVLLLLAGGGWALYRNWDALAPPTVPTGPEARQTTGVAERRSIRFAVTAAGDIGPAEQVSVRPEVNGKIAQLPVDIGDRIKKDQVLFTLDDFDLQTERASRLTDIERTKLELEKASRDFERSKRLMAEKLISEELFEDTRTEFELKKNSLERALKDLSLVEYRLTKTKILAPFDCTVLTRPVSVGQAVSGSGGFNSGTEVLTIANLNDMVINAHINQADIPRLSQNQEVDVQVESVPDLKVKGLVERIAPQTTIRNNIKGYAVRIALKGLDARVLPGMTANISIPVAYSENALAIPMAAVFTEKGERFIFVKNDEKFERRPVQIGVADFDYAEVLNGLTEGEVVSLEIPPGETVAKLAQKPPSGSPMGLGGQRSGGTGGGTNSGTGAGRPAGGGGGTARPAGGARPSGGTK